MNAVLRFLRGEPALAYQTVLSVIVALVVAYAHLNHTQNDYLTAIALAVGTLVTAFLARPVRVGVVGGAVGTILSSLVVFSVHFPRPVIGAVVAAVGLIVGSVYRTHLTPVSK